MYAQQPGRCILKFSLSLANDGYGGSAQVLTPAADAYIDVGSKHMKRDLVIIFGLIICCIPTYGQLTLKELKFDGWFGHALNGKTETIYSLLGTGFFRTPRADNTDSLISSWTNQHPDAVVIPIYTSGPTMTDSPESKMIYSWVVDRLDTLNIILVRHGCVPGGTMQRTKTWDEMTKEQRKSWHDNKKPSEQVHVDSKTYTDFLDQVMRAESFAKERRLGIWIQKKE